MNDARRLVALLVAVMGLGTAVCGVVRGLSSTGPARGTRMIVAIAPPVDAAAIGIAQRSAQARLEETGTSTRVVAAGGQLVGEIPEQDPASVAGEAALLERTAKVELATGSATVDARTLRRIDIIDQGVAVQASAPVPFKLGAPITFAEGGTIKLAASPDHVDGASFHVPMASAPQLDDLYGLLLAGAAHPMHVTHREPFTRATGILPRAWPFLAFGAVLVAAGALGGRRKR